MNVHGSFSNKHPKLETGQMSTNRWMGKQKWYTIPWNTNQPLKGKNCGYTQQYGWISTFWLTEGGHKSVYCVIPLIWNSRKGKSNLQWLKADESLSKVGVWDEEGLWRGTVFGADDGILYLNHGMVSWIHKLVKTQRTYKMYTFYFNKVRFF